MLTYQDIYLLAFDCLVIAGTAASSVLCPPYPPFIIRNSLFDAEGSPMANSTFLDVIAAEAISYFDPHLKNRSV
jgi:hypothetical protein